MQTWRFTETKKSTNNKQGWAKFRIKKKQQHLLSIYEWELNECEPEISCSTTQEVELELQESTDLIFICPTPVLWQNINAIIMNNYK